jgi:hypothetical protein
VADSLDPRSVLLQTMKNKMVGKTKLNGGTGVTCSPRFLPLVSWVHPLEMDHAAKPFH